MILTYIFLINLILLFPHCTYHSIIIKFVFFDDKRMATRSIKWSINMYLSINQSINVYNDDRSQQSDKLLTLDFSLFSQACRMYVVK